MEKRLTDALSDSCPVYRHHSGVGVPIPQERDGFIRALDRLQSLSRLHENLINRQVSVECMREWALNNQGIEVSDDADEIESLYKERANVTQNHIDAIKGMLVYAFWGETSDAQGL